MEKRKLTKADIDKVRNIEGFPIGSDEDIIALSDAPYYTACPNPFIEEFIKENGTPYDEATDDYHREPFAADVSEGKKDPIYNAHSYHTKVPYKAIMRYILHYTKPGDIIFDGFCGSGMTAVAAQMCGTDDYELKYSLLGNDNSKVWGARKAVISDLAPAATYISAIYNLPSMLIDIEKIFKRIISKVKNECDWMYQTKLSDDHILLLDEPLHVNYTVWSDVFICPHCGNEIVFWDYGIDKETGSVKNNFSCPHCGVLMSKKSCQRAKINDYDSILNCVVRYAKQVPVRIAYEYEGKEYYKKPDADDLALFEKIKSTPISHSIPVAKLPIGFNTEQPRKSHGVEYLHQFYTRRNLIVLSALWDAIKHEDCDICAKYALFGTVTGIMQGVSKLQRFRLNSTFPNMILSGTLYIASQVREWNPIDWVQGKFKAVCKLRSKTSFFKRGDCTISTNSLTNVPANDNWADYIFTDPPFGGNLNYSELSFMWEAWLGVCTNNKAEAIINGTQKKELPEYQQLMERCFCECFRILKPNHWMTIEFHNSKNSVWNSIQEALQKAGFIIADVRTLDKKQSSFKQINFNSAVKQDLVISAYKPKKSFKNELLLKAGSEETAWAFVREHLSKLPVVVDSDSNGKIDILVERQPYLLFDRMVAYHIMNGIPVPIDSQDFYRGLDKQFLKRDGMYFLPNQVNEYDTARIRMNIEPTQFTYFVTNEKSAIAWLYQQLVTPQTYQQLQPKFMQEIKSIDKFEDMPELFVLLEENFIQDDQGRWYIPDRTKEGDIAKLREKNLWKEFESYRNSKGKLKLFRSEAIRVGFSRLWKEKNYAAIVAIAERLPEQTIQEDPSLLMYYDISLGRM